MRKLTDYLRKQPVESWALLAFLMAYCLFFIRPVFLGSDGLMKFPRYVPSTFIGRDLQQMLSYCQSWLIDKDTPYIGENLYPPFATLFFSPLLLFEFSTSYAIMTIVNVACYLCLTLLIPIMVCKPTRSRNLLILLFALTGINSYGFQFEVERGQFNLVAFLFSMLAIYIYHYRHDFRRLAYLLLTVAIQLKVYPAIFIVMFVRDWRDWKGNLTRLLGLAAFNGALLFILGYQVFFDFVGAIARQMRDPYIWVGNHSIKAFAVLSTDMGLEKFHLDSWLWLRQYTSLVQVVLSTFVAACLLLILLRAYRRRSGGLDPVLLVGCTIGALVIPAVSHDYKLPLLTTPMIIALCSLAQVTDSPARLPTSVLAFVASLAYSSTLFSYTNRPFPLLNPFPLLMVMLASFTILAVFGDVRRSRQQCESSCLDG